MEYYLSVGSEKRGPYSVGELAARGIGAESLVMAADGGSWQPAWQVEALRPILRQQTAAQQSQPIVDSGVNISSGSDVSSPSGPGVSNASGGEQVIVGERIGEGPDVVQGYAPQPSAQPESERTVPPSVDRGSRKHRGGCLWVVLAMLLLLAGLLVATCPKPEQHAEAISGVVAETMGEALQIDSIDSDDPFSTAMKSLAGGATRQVVAMVVGNALTVDNYLVCSLGRIHYADKAPVVSVGVLGHVFTIDKSSLKQLAHRYAEETKRRLEENVKQKVRESITLPIGRMLDEAMGGLMDELAGELFGRQGHQDEPAQDDEDVMMDSI